MVNSFASSVTARNPVVVHRRLARGHDVEVVETNRRGHATRFAHDAVRRGIDVVISGHSHRPLIETSRNVLYLNPGSAGPRRFKLPITLAFLQAGQGAPRADLCTIID